jgi:hypothetical protein
MHFEFHISIVLTLLKSTNSESNSVVHCLPSSCGYVLGYLLLIFICIFLTHP